MSTLAERRILDLISWSSFLSLMLGEPPESAHFMSEKYDFWLCIRSKFEFSGTGSSVFYLRMYFWIP